MFKLLHELRKDESGATAIEYGLIVSLVVIAMIVSLSSVADESTKLWTKVSEKSGEAMEKANN